MSARCKIGRLCCAPPTVHPNPPPGDSAMSQTRDVYVVSAARTAIGTFGGTLKDTTPADLATVAVKAALQRSGVAPDSVGHLAMGTVVLTEPRDVHLSRVAAINAGLSKETPAFNVNRLCGSRPPGPTSAPPGPHPGGWGAGRGGG